MNIPNAANNGVCAHSENYQFFNTSIRNAPLSTELIDLVRVTKKVMELLYY